MNKIQEAIKILSDVSISETSEQLSNRIDKARIILKSETEPQDTLVKDICKGVDEAARVLNSGEEITLDKKRHSPTYQNWCEIRKLCKKENKT